jgi:hypothetical protein
MTVHAFGEPGNGSTLLGRMRKRRILFEGGARGANQKFTKRDDQVFKELGNSSRSGPVQTGARQHGGKSTLSAADFTICTIGSETPRSLTAPVVRMRIGRQRGHLPSGGPASAVSDPQTSVILRKGIAHAN